jgi:serine/threonine protein kinase
MEISLEQLHSGLTLKEGDIAFVCKEVRQAFDQHLLLLINRLKIFHGLWYIHRDLSICHTRIDCSNIFLSAEGRVKIGQYHDIFLFVQ